MTAAKRTPNRNRNRSNAGGLGRQKGDEDGNTETEKVALGGRKGKAPPPAPNPLPSGPNALGKLLADNAKRKKVGKSAAANVGTQSAPYTRKSDGRQLVKWQGQIHLDVHLELEAFLKTLESSAGYNRTDVLSTILRDGTRMHRKALRVA